MDLQERLLVGIEYLGAVTALLQRQRNAHPTAGLYEAADFQWWWRTARPTDAWPQLFWFDRDGLPAAAAIATDWGDRVTVDILIDPNPSETALAEIVGRGLEHAADNGATTIEVPVDRADTPLRALLDSVGLRAQDDEIVTSWMRTDRRPPVSPIANGYELVSRAVMADGPHHMVPRSGADVEQRLRHTSLYRSDLDLYVVDSSLQPVAYGLFWFDPVTRVGLVEPMRTEDDHQGRGLARHVLTSGIDRLVRSGATRIKISHEPRNPASSALYPGVGFEYDMTSISYGQPT